MQEITIGRDHSRVDVPVPENQPTVSRLHAKLVPQGNDRFVLIDLGSRAGTFVQRRGGWDRVQQTDVSRDDIIRLGSMEVSVHHLVGDLDKQHNLSGQAGTTPRSNRRPVFPEVESAAAPDTPTKSKITAGVLALLLGGIGVHKFYLGYWGAGVIMLLLGTVGWILVIPAVANSIFAFIEGVIYLTTDDETFHRTYVVGRKAWF